MRKYNWSKEAVEKAVKVSNCWFECLYNLGVPKVGGNYRTLKNVIARYGLDTSHFVYRYAKTHNGKHRFKHLNSKTDDQIFSEGVRIKVENLKREYIIRILNGQARCQLCGITEWQGKTLTFQLHHIDGNHLNHSLSNLQLLCPNCHSQTDNYSNKKRKELKASS
jgi:Zn finger protein HypA/HybF involved in hydrogenase expression